MKISEAKLREMIQQTISNELDEGKLGKIAAGLMLGGALTTMPSCSYFNNEPTNHWEHEGPYSAQEKQEKTWNTHQERGDWNNVEPGVGFIYDCYTRCANSGGGWTIYVIFKDKSTGEFILPQHPEEFLFGRYLPNCNCFENESTTDRVNTNGLQRINGSENQTVFEKKNDIKNMENTVKLNENQLRQVIKESIKKILDESRYADAIADRMFAQLQRETNPVKKRQLQQELISMGYLQVPTKQPQQQTQQSGNIYSQIKDALNTNNQAFFRGINGNTLKTAVDTMYNQGKITDNERNKCYQWIGQGFRYSQAPGNYNW